MIKCNKCGKFMRGDSKYSWAAIYSIRGLEYEAFRCVECTGKYGAVESNACPHNGDMSPYQGFNIVRDAQTKEGIKGTFFEELTDIFKSQREKALILDETLEELIEKWEYLISNPQPTPASAENMLLGIIESIQTKLKE